MSEKFKITTVVGERSYTQEGDVELHVRKMKKPKTSTKEGITSSIGQDLDCRDCGADLQAAPTQPYHLVCSRLAKWAYQKNEDGTPLLTLPEVGENEVIECNNWNPPEPDLREVIPT